MAEKHRFASITISGPVSLRALEMALGRLDAVWREQVVDHGYDLVLTIIDEHHGLQAQQAVGRSIRSELTHISNIDPSGQVSDERP